MSETRWRAVLRNARDVIMTMEATNRLRWWSEARFGLFVHYGLCSIPEPGITELKFYLLGGGLL